MKRAMIVGALAVGGLVAWNLWDGGSSAGGLLPYDVPDALAAGEALYAENCASCHGAALEGQADWRAPGPDGRMPAPPHDPSGHTWHHSDEVLFRITKYGTAAVVGGGYQSDMPGFEGRLTDAQILQVLGYIKSTWPQDVIETHNRISAQQAQ